MIICRRLKTSGTLLLQNFGITLHLSQLGFSRDCKKYIKISNWYHFIFKFKETKQSFDGGCCDPFASTLVLGGSLKSHVESPSARLTLIKLPLPVDPISSKQWSFFIPKMSCLTNENKTQVLASWVCKKRLIWSFQAGFDQISSYQVPVWLI